MSSEVDTCETQLGAKTTNKQSTRITEWCNTAAKEVAAATKEKQIKKFNNLL